MSIVQQLTTRASITPALLAVLTIAHEDMSMDMDSGMSTGTHAAPITSPSGHSNTLNIQCEAPMSYFTCGKHSGIIIAHILLMILGWVLVLPSGEQSFNEVLGL